MKKIKYLIIHLSNIIRGFFNYYFGKHSEIRKERLTACRLNLCGLYDPKGESEAAYVPGKESCGGCGCLLKTKTADLGSACHLTEIGQKGYWDKVVLKAINDKN